MTTGIPTSIGLVSYLGGTGLKKNAEQNILVPRNTQDMINYYKIFTHAIGISMSTIERDDEK